MNKAIGIADSAEAIEHRIECLQCGALTQLNHGVRINCLLHEGLETKGEPSREALKSILSVADIADKQWRLGHYEILEEIERRGIGVEA